MIELGKIIIKDYPNLKSRLIAPVRIDNEDIQTIWFEVDHVYRDYLCSERSDAFIVGMLNYAMRKGHDISFKTPISDELYYNLEVELIDALCKTGKSYYRTKLIGAIASDVMPKGNAVATGISCGVDSFFTIANHIDDKIESYKLTHLTFNNVGSHGEGEVADKLYKQRVQRSRDFAHEYNIPLIESNSNIHDVIVQNHFMTHTYSSMFAVLCLQKLYKKYYYSSGKELKYITLDKSDVNNCTHYEYILLKCFSINGLDIHSEGLNSNRTDKLETIKDYKPSYRYLNVCIPENKNCGKCEKCMRTLLGLEAVGALDKYRDVFDIDEYLKYRSYNYAFLFKYKLLKKEDYTCIYPKLDKHVNILHKLYAVYLLGVDLIVRVASKMVSCLPEKNRNKIKQIFRKYRDR